MREERKKRIINYVLCTTFHLSDDRKQNIIATKKWWERLVHTAPSAFKFSSGSTSNDTPFTLVQDVQEKYPMFERHLYCHLDYDMIILMIGYISLIDIVTQNPMLAITVAYFIERFFRFLRGYLGEKNIVKKTLTSDVFLL